jgi:putative transferase (TIGR04331 family)
VLVGAISFSRNCLLNKTLVTTALEESWGTNHSISFLGDWCTLHSRKEIWSSRDYQIIPYHWRSSETFSSDYLYLRTVYETTLLDIATSLNKIHEVKHSLRYWRILIGPWVQYFVQILFDRWQMLEIASNQTERFSTICLEIPHSWSIPQDFSQFLHFIETDIWNHTIYSQLLRLKNEINLVNQPLINMLELKSKFPSVHSNRTIKQGLTIGSIYNKFATRFSKESDSFFVGTMLPIADNLRLQIRLGQIPRLWNTDVEVESKFNPEMRNWCLVSSGSDNFIRSLYSLIPMNIPLIYLEGYKKLESKIETLPWPSKPKIIFTSIQWSSHDVFKAWTATKVETGSRLIIGQHGGAHGAARYMAIEEHQIEISDLFLSWGWSGGEKVHPIGDLRCLKPNFPRRNGNRGIIINAAYPRYSYWLTSIPKASQYLDYLEDQWALYREIPQHIQDRLDVRIYMSDYGWSQEDRWKEQFPNVSIDRATTPLISRLHQIQLAIHTYNSTTLLESLFFNIPTVIYFNQDYFEIRDEVKPFFLKLRNVGIFHETPKSAAKHIGTVWSDINLWWLRSDLQEIREEFCHRYVRQITKPAKQLESALKPFL